MSLLYSHDAFLLTAQYPPVDSPLSEFSLRIAEALSKKARVYLIAPGLDWRDAGELKIRGFINPVYDHQNVITWAFSACREAERIVATMIYEEKARGPVIAINWELFPAALSLGRYFSLPIHFIPHSFEAQRAGLSSLLSIAIGEIERMAIRDSRSIILFGNAVSEYYYQLGGKSESALELSASELQPSKKEELASALTSLLQGSP